MSTSVIWQLEPLTASALQSTPCPEKRCHFIFEYNSRSFWWIFFTIFILLETGMNTPQSHVIYLLNGLMTSHLWDITRHESFPHYNVGYEKCSTLFLTITMVISDFDNFSAIGNRNKYPTKYVQTVSLQPNCVSTLPGKTKNSTQLTAVSSVERSKLLFYVCLFPCSLEDSFSSFLTENLLHSHEFFYPNICLQTQYG